MSCSCNCSPCNCQPRPSICCTPTTESVEYTFENANLVGVGVFDNVTDYLVQFRGIVSDSAALTVTLDAGDNAIVLAFDQDALVADIPDANTTTRGILETATNAEAIAKAALDKILTPSNLAAIGASDTFAGLVELATDAETQAGVSTTLAVTPAGLASTIVLSNTVTWADAVTRLAATPSFDGQFGTQLDSDVVYVSTGTAPGNFAKPLLTLESTSNEAVTPTILSLQSSFAFVKTAVNGVVTFDTEMELETTRTFGVEGTIAINGGGVIDFTGGQIYIGGVLLQGDKLLGGDNSGSPTAYAIDQFISSFNTQTGWATPTGTLDRGGFVAYNGQAISNPPTQAEVQAIDDAVVLVSQHLAALITDLKAQLLPAT